LLESDERFSVLAGQSKGPEENKMGQKSSELEKTLTLAPAVGLAITLVLGSGLLILPGLAYDDAGGAAVYAWVIAALASVPLLIVFARLGADIPGAGGVAGFIQASFSRRAAAATELVILGALPVGAAVAITGGQYFAAIFNGQDWLVYAGALIIWVVGLILNYLGAKVSGAVQQVLAFVLVALLTGVAIVALILGDTSGGTGVAPLSQATGSLPTVGIVFFAFAGWELLSFITEELKNPKRDFPLAIGISFGIVVSLYLLMALTIQHVLPISDPRMTEAPIAALMTISVGESSARFIGVVGFFLVMANYISAAMVISRLVFSSAREGLLPLCLSHVQTEAKIPRNAVLAVMAFVFLVGTPTILGWVYHSLLFELAGISFLMIYILAVLAYIKRAKRWPARVFGLATLIFVGVVFLNLGTTILYPIVIFIIGLILGHFRLRPGSRS
jgi:amino acid efflux transporter